MTPRQRSESAPASTMGLLVKRRASAFAKGTRAPKLALLSMLAFVALAVAAAPTFAAAPEAPVMTVTPVFASIADFNGTLSPKGTEPAEGTYEFRYQETKAKTGCEGGKSTTPGIALGGSPEPLNPEQVSGLKPATEYTACLVAENESKVAKSPLVTFKTNAATKPEAPEATESARLSSSGVTLVGVVNPKAEGEPGTWQFVYRKSATECQGAGGLETAKETAPGASGQTVIAELAELPPGTTYTFCVRAFNALGEATVGNHLSFTTTIPPEPPTGEEASAPSATTVKLNGILFPGQAGEPGTYRFFYAPSATSCTEGASQFPVEGEPGIESHGVKGEATHQETITGLQPATTYSFCIQAANRAEEVADGTPVQFTTLTAAPEVTGEAASAIAEAGATITAQVNPHGLPTSYQVQYVTQAQYAESEWTHATRAPEPASQLPGSNTPVTVTVRLSGLAASTAYRFRIAAVNTSPGAPAGTSGETVGTGGELETPAASAASSGLPDDRAYELIASPGSGEPAIRYEAFYSNLHRSFAPFQVAAAGNAIAFPASSPEPPLEGGNSEGSNSANRDQWLAVRTATGWHLEDIATPKIPPEYQTFSSDLATGYISYSCLLYARSSSTGAVKYVLPKELPAGAGACGVPLYAGASSGESEVLFQDTAALTPDAVPATEFRPATTNATKLKPRYMAAVCSAATCTHSVKAISRW